MTTMEFIVEIAVRLHKEKLLSHEDLMGILQDLVNANALDNGYADKYGLPFPAPRPDHMKA